MEEKLTEKILKTSIQTKVIPITIREKGVFFIFFNIFMPADKIRKITQTCIPLNADATTVIDKNKLKNNEMK